MMPLIKLTLEINADIQVCFDLARSIDFHQLSTGSTKKKAIAGRTTGLIGLNETVTWEAVHFGIRQKLTSRITAFEAPGHSRDEQVKGAFTFIKHDHWFEARGGRTVMTDRFEFGSPLGILGSLFNRLILTNYLRSFLLRRNKMIKEYAESGRWKEVSR